MKEHIKELKSLLKKDSLKTLFEGLDKCLTKESEKYDDFILIVSSYRNLNKKILDGLLEVSAENVELAKIRRRVMILLNSLEPGDISLMEITTRTGIKLADNYKDLPPKILLAFGKLTTDYAFKKVKENTELMENQLKKLIIEKEEKDKTAGKEYRKLEALFRKGSKNKKLINKQIKAFSAAFKPYNKEVINFAKHLNIYSEDLSLLLLFLISNYKIKKDDLSDLVSRAKKVIGKMSNLIEKIESDNRNIENDPTLNSYGIEKEIQDTYKTNSILKVAIENYVKEIRILEEGIIALKQ